jgi:hypothetical protein
MSFGARTWTLQQLLDERCIEVGNCVEWQGNINTAGHPMMSYLGKPTLVRRVAWCLAHSLALHDIQGLRLWNTCANRLCINPACTRAGTYKAMFRAMVAAGRTESSPSKRAACARIKRAASSLTMDDVRAIRAAAARGALRKDLAARYGKSDSLIDKIVSGQCWRETVLPGASIFSMGGA